MRKLNKAIIMAVISVFTVQMIAPAVIETFDVLSSDMEMRRIIREKCGGVIAEETV